MSVIALAANTAFRAHWGQTRDDGETPFFHHLVEVTGFLADFGIASQPLVAAAYLHDIVEDTVWTAADVHATFGEDIGRLVDEVTDPPGHTGVRAKDRQLKLAHDGFYSVSGTLIKIADKRANILDTVDAPWEPDAKKEYVASSLAITSMAATHHKDNDLVQAVYKKMRSSLEEAISKINSL